MEVKAGYKQTDIGVIPTEWDEKSAGELSPFVTSGSRGWARYYSNRGSLFVRITNLSREVIYPDLTNQKLVDLPRSATEGLRTALQAGDILVSITADIGIIGYVDDQFPTPAYINQHIACVRFPPEKVNSKFASYYLASSGPQKRFAEATDVGAKSGINLNTVRALRLVCPPLPEQQAIANALSDVDQLIASLDQLIAKKRDLKQAAMQQLLTGKTRLAGFSGEWKTKRLGEVVAIVKGQLITQDTVVDGTIPVIAGGKKPAYFHNIANRFGKTITVSGSGASAGYVAKYDEPIFASDCCTISEGSTYDLDYIYYYLLSRQSHIYRSQTGGAQPHIHPKDLQPMIVGIPSHGEQVAIAATLSDMDAELTELAHRRDKTIALKQGMMQELLTGRTRLV